jgi:hypothetical protein
MEGEANEDEDETRRKRTMTAERRWGLRRGETYRAYISDIMSISASA